MIDRGNPLRIGWTTKRKKDRNEFQMFQKTEKNILWFGECSCLEQWNQEYSLERISWTIAIPSRNKRSHIETNVRHIYKIGVWTRWYLWIGNNWLGKSFMETPVFDWWRKSCQSSAHEGLRLSGFCVVSWEDFRTPNRTMHGNKDRDG